MPLDNANRLAAADYRKIAGDYFMDAAKAAYSGSLWMAGYEAKRGADWLKRADDLEKAEKEAARVESECAAFDAAMAECG